MMPRTEPVLTKDHFLHVLRDLIVAIYQVVRDLIVVVVTGRYRAVHLFRLCAVWFDRQGMGLRICCYSMCAARKLVTCDVRPVLTKPVLLPEQPRGSGRDVERAVHVISDPHSDPAHGTT
eukprot:1581540-Rhodomonas_salina.3